MFLSMYLSMSKNTETINYKISECCKLAQNIIRLHTGWARSSTECCIIKLNTTIQTMVSAQTRIIPEE